MLLGDPCWVLGGEAVKMGVGENKNEAQKRDQTYTSAFDPPFPKFPTAMTMYVVPVISDARAAT